jgi:hypothetical protein
MATVVTGKSKEYISLYLPGRKENNYIHMDLLSHNSHYDKEIESCAPWGPDYAVEGQQ